ncbi:uncharacterized protein TrAtP1_004070 [Trichoderma atroviride]|uniref:uncharacterized protein n=1 Tax=Hypocrea atroviridis TaxID=63577 RepID=UPI003318FEFC|nr:hypothetical protein TrAtP1_004070 [Trichoderma atroviride]
MPSADVERLDDGDGGKQGRESIAAGRTRASASLNRKKASLGTEQPETQLTSKDGNEATGHLPRTGASDWRGKTSYTYRKEEDSGDYDVQLQSRKAKRHGELDI